MVDLDEFFDKIKSFGFDLRLALTRNIALKLIDKVHKTTDKAVDKKSTLTEEDFGKIVGLMEKEVKEAGILLDKKRNPSDRTDVRIGLHI